MLFAENVKNSRRPASVFVSMAAHAAVLALLFLALGPAHTRPVYTESRCCSDALYWAPNTSAASAKPKHAVRIKRPTPLPAPASQPVLASAPAAIVQTATQTGAISPQQQATLGAGAGSEDAEPALPLYYPQPGVPDRSLLPAAQQNVVVEVDISALGEVTDERLVHGLGNGLDQIVLDTVKVWRFHPATLKGTAVASVEDLVFPFNLDYQPPPNPS